MNRKNVVLLGSAVVAITMAAVIATTIAGRDASPFDSSGTTSAHPPRPGLSAHFPAAKTTGVPDGIRLRPSSDLTITAPGTVIDGYDIDGVVLVRADNVVIRNSRIQGSGWWSVEVEDGLTGVVVENCDIDGQGERGASNSMGVMGPATVRGNDISGVENGVTPGTGSIVEGNYIHDLFAPGEPHYDGIQIDGNVSDVIIRNNTIIVDHDQTSAVMIANDLGPSTNISVEDNYLAGGGYTVYADGQFDGGPISGVRFVDNTMLRGHWGYASIQGNTPEISGNVAAESGEHLPLTDGR